VKHSQTNSEVPRHLTRADVAGMLGVSLSTVARMLRGPAPQLPSIYIGRAVRIPADAVARIARLVQGVDCQAAR